MQKLIEVDMINISIPHFILSVYYQGIKMLARPIKHSLFLKVVYPIQNENISKAKESPRGESFHLMHKDTFIYNMGEKCCKDIFLVPKQKKMF